MQTILIAAALVSGIATIASDWRQQRRALFYLAKPLTTLLLTALAWVSLPEGSYRSWVLAAFIACWVGDVALMFTGTRAFVLGLSSFLIGHLLLITAFLTGLPLAPFAVPSGYWLLGLVVLIAVALYTRWLLPRTGKLRLPVLLYLTALITMVLAALLRAGLSDAPAAGAALAGALLFALSDAVLAYRKFVTAPWWGQPLTLLTYYSALGLIAVAA